MRIYIEVVLINNSLEVWSRSYCGGYIKSQETLCLFNGQGLEVAEGERVVNFQCNIKWYDSFAVKFYIIYICARNLIIYCYFGMTHRYNKSVNKKIDVPL